LGLQHGGQWIGTSYPVQKKIEYAVASHDMTPRSKGQRSRSQGRVSSLNKKCNNSVLGSPLNFKLGG